MIMDTTVTRDVRAVELFPSCYCSMLSFRTRMGKEHHLIISLNFGFRMMITISIYPSTKRCQFQTRWSEKGLVVNKETYHGFRDKTNVLNVNHRWRRNKDPTLFMKTFGNALNKESKEKFRKYMWVFRNAFPTRPRMTTGHFLT